MTRRTLCTWRGGQAQKIDRVFTDAADRLRGQLVHADRILTGDARSSGRRGLEVQPQFLAAGAESLGAGAGNQGRASIFCGRAVAAKAAMNRAKQQEEELFI